tara:strand:+ start:248 stop:538 length:291 start_codon:yes stop_codon:yes gene_type:complete
MTQISSDDVRHLARLSSLQLDDKEVEALQTDLTNILEYIEQLAELDTEGVEPTYQVTNLENIWRADKVDTYGVSGETLVELASNIEKNQIKVPKVL